jgi:hypothetical protein
MKKIMSGREETFVFFALSFGNRYDGSILLQQFRCLCLLYDLICLELKCLHPIPGQLSPYCKPGYVWVEHAFEYSLPTVVVLAANVYVICASCLSFM